MKKNEKIRKYSLGLVGIFIFNNISINTLADPIINENQLVVEELEENNIVDDSNILVNESEKEEIEINFELINEFKAPSNNSKTTENVYLRGIAKGSNIISKVEIYLNGEYVANARYGINVNGEKIGYEYALKNLKDGFNEIKTIVTDEQNNVSTKIKNIMVNSKQKTNIMGIADLNKEKMVQALINKNPSKDLNDAYYFVDEVIEEANAENVRYDIMFAQIMHETNYLKFGGDVKEEQNNFAGIGATGNGEPGNSFESVEIGIRAVAQHLKAYASLDPLNRECVDPRFKYVQRGTATLLEHLGINENPEGKGWAVNIGYGYLIFDILENIKTINIDNLSAKINFIDVVGDLEVNNRIKIKGVGSENALYKISIRDNNGNWEVLKEYNEISDIDWIPNAEGKYRIVIDVKSKNSIKEYDDYKFLDLEIKNKVSHVKNLGINGELYINKNITFKAEADREDSLYRFLIKDYSKNQWNTLSDFSQKKEIIWKPQNAGKYRIVVDVKHKSSNNEYDDYYFIDFDVKEANSILENFLISGKPYVGSGLKFETTKKEDTLYKFSIKNYKDNKWSVLKEYSIDNKLDFIPKEVGKYRIVIDSKHKYSEKEYDDYKFIDFEILKDEAIINSFDIVGDKKTNSKLQLKVNAITPNETLYKYTIKDYKDGKWHVLKEYSDEDIYEWVPDKPGKYRIVFDVKDSKSDKEYDTFVYKDIDIEPSTLAQINSWEIIDGNKAGEKTIKVKGDSESTALYKYSLKDYSTNKWTTIKDYSEANEVIFNVNKGGKYRVVVDIKDKYSKNEYDSYQFRDIDIYSNVTANITGLRVKGTNNINDEKIIVAQANSSNDILYKYVVVDKVTGKTEIVQDYSLNQEYKWKVKEPSQYNIVAYVKDCFSNKEYDAKYSVDTEIYGPGIIKNKNSGYSGKISIGEILNFRASADSRNGTLYRYVIKNADGEWKTLREYSIDGNINYKIPNKDGVYRMVVDYKDKYSNRDYDDYDYFTFRVFNGMPEAIDLGLEFDFGLEGPSPNKPQKLVMHHAAGNATVQSVHNFHKNGNGWAGIGYHFYIHKDGTIYKGREENWRGAHAAEVPTSPNYNDGILENDVNATSLGISVQGDYMKETSMPKAQEEAVVKVGKYAVEKYGISQIFKHGDYGIGQTSCPGKYYPYERIKAKILAGSIYGIDTDNLDKIKN